jgi:hypothetical protein
MYLPHSSTRRAHLWELEGTRSLRTQREYHLLSTGDGGLSTATLWSSGSKRLSQRSVAGGWRSADRTQLMLFGHQKLTGLFGPQTKSVANRVWTRSKYVDNRFTRETKVNRQLRKHLVESTF